MMSSSCRSPSVTGDTMCVAIPGRILSIGEASPALVPAEVAFPHRTMTVNLVMVPEAGVGDTVIVHSGFAIRVVARDDAADGRSPLAR
jgi:hydrogenase expression/formation protein HypC